MNPIFQEADGNTALSAEEQVDLIPSLSARAELNAAERANINEARLWAMRPAILKREDLVTDAFSRELHKRMFNYVWRWAGHYRKSEKNLGWEVQRLAEGVCVAFDDARYWLQHGTYPLHETAARLHHRLVQIHPWPNGNGRHARLMADLVMASRGMEPLSWGANADLASVGEIRTRYIHAIRSADAGDFGPLLIFTRS
jgi:Fic-DOC domain mobile mystery protein B